jgi:hypothetical protein
MVFVRLYKFSNDNFFTSEIILPTTPSLSSKFFIDSPLQGNAKHLILANSHSHESGNPQQQFAHLGTLPL